MKPRVWKKRDETEKWLSAAFGWRMWFDTWCEAFDWAYAHATQHKEEQ